MLLMKRWTDDLKHTRSTALRLEAYTDFFKRHLPSGRQDGLLIKGCFWNKWVKKHADGILYD